MLEMEKKSGDIRQAILVREKVGFNNEFRKISLGIGIMMFFSLKTIVFIESTH